MPTDAAPPTARPDVHTRELPGFGLIRLRPVDPAGDADLLHGWVTQERARFWGMADASRERVREIYAHLDSLPTHHAYLMLRDDAPVALFQTYEPEHDPIGEYYDVQPGDFGIHLLIGPPAGPPAPGFTGTLLAEFLTFVLADPARRRIVAEPDARNDRVLARLRRAGFVPGPRVELPHKPAQLLFLDRTAHRR
ncbi:GNAT family N-acetyltransferase [Micromonosporaceae bacterium DT194]|uniref:GNAT family N-acetyltransferase n=1 Tax=Melissospora conviva TaxID=3388432 RepID=UPI003C138DA0